jgi:hypothetical protein
MIKQLIGHLRKSPTTQRKYVSTKTWTTNAKTRFSKQTTKGKSRWSKLGTNYYLFVFTLLGHALNCFKNIYIRIYGDIKSMGQQQIRFGNTLRKMLYSLNVQYGIWKVI